jgi:hypothetical protein
MLSRLDGLCIGLGEQRHSPSVKSDLDYCCEHVSYLGWTANFHDLSSTCPQCSLSSDHGGGITHHQDTDKWVTIPVPADDSFIIIVGAVCQLFLVCRHRKVYMGNLVVYDGNKFNASDLRDDGQCFRVLPRVECEFPVAMDVSMHSCQPCRQQG